MSTCEGLDADPASDPCEKAEKQLTALVLNDCSGYLQEYCDVDVSAAGCSSTSVGDLILEAADLIHGGFCQQAADCVGAVNEGDALVSDDGGEALASSAPQDSIPEAPPAPDPVADSPEDETSSGDRWAPKQKVRKQILRR